MDVAGITASKDDAQNFLYFVQELREQLDLLTNETGEVYLLTAAIGTADELLETMRPDGKYDYIDYVKDRQLRGIMYWEHSLDLTGELLNAAVKQW